MMPAVHCVQPWQLCAQLGVIGSTSCPKLPARVDLRRLAELQRVWGLSVD
jgi:hypothetical protein